MFVCSQLQHTYSAVFLLLVTAASDLLVHKILLNSVLLSPIVSGGVRPKLPEKRAGGEREGQGRNGRRREKGRKREGEGKEAGKKGIPSKQKSWLWRPNIKSLVLDLQQRHLMLFSR